MNTIEWISKILIIIGALHIGIAAFSSFDLIGILSVSWLITLVSALIGIAGIWEIVKIFKK